MAVPVLWQTKHTNQRNVNSLSKNAILYFNGNSAFEAKHDTSFLFRQGAFVFVVPVVLYCTLRKSFSRQMPHLQSWQLDFWDSTLHKQIGYNATTNRKKLDKMFVETRTEIIISRMMICFSFWDDITSGICLRRLYVWGHCNYVMRSGAMTATCKSIEEYTSKRWLRVRKT